MILLMTGLKPTTTEKFLFEIYQIAVRILLMACLANAFALKKTNKMTMMQVLHLNLSLSTISILYNKLVYEKKFCVSAFSSYLLYYFLR